MMRRIHYAWAICFACLWLYLCNIGMCSNILTVYLPFIEAEGVSDSMGSSILSVRCLFSFLVLFFVEAYYRRVSIRRGVALASLTAVAAPLVFCLARTHPMLYYVGAALAGTSYGACCVYPVSLLLTNWFRSRRGLAVGISCAGSGLATMIFAPFLSSVILKSSLTSAFLIHAAFQALSLVMVYLILRDRPEEKGLEPYTDGAADKAKIRRGPENELPRHIIWLLALTLFMCGGAGVSFNGHLSVLTVSSGYAPQTAAKMMSLFGFLLVVGKLLGGAIADRIGARRCTVLLNTVFVAGCLCVLGMNGHSMFWPFALVVLLGFGAAVYTVGQPLWAADLAKPERYGKMMRLFQIFYNLGGIIFTTVPGLIAERTGEYKSSYFLFAAMMFLVTVFLLYAYRVARRGSPARP